MPKRPPRLITSTLLHVAYYDTPLPTTVICDFQTDNGINCLALATHYHPASCRFLCLLHKQILQTRGVIDLDTLTFCQERFQ
jgi:hypothetical protein